MEEKKIPTQDLKNKVVEEGLKGSSGFKPVNLIFPGQKIWEEEYSNLSSERKILLETQEQTKLIRRILSETQEQTILIRQISNNVLFYFCLTIISFALSITVFFILG